MSQSANILRSIFGMLNDSVEYAVLRNYEGLPEQNDSRDIDIVMRRKDYGRIISPLAAVVAEHGWQVVTLLKSDRLVTWVIGHVGDNAQVELVQLDFFFDTSVFGIRLLSADELLAGRRFNGRIYHVSKSMEFLDKYMYDRAVGAQYPQKYNTVRAAAESAPEVREKLEQVFGVSDVSQADKTSSKKLLMHTFLRNPLACLCRFVRFESMRLRNYFCGTGFSIGFTGPDGVGKSTVIDGMIEILGPVFRKAHTVFHFRPTLFGNLGDVAHSAGLKKEVDRNYSAPHRGGRTGIVGSLARLTYYSVDYIAGYFTKVKPLIRITRIVIFDRYFTDIICDSRRTRIYLPVWFLYVWKKLLIPSLDYNILLTAPTETILSRKQELDAEGIASINKTIDYLARKKGYIKVINTGTPQDAITGILRPIFESQNAKNLKRLGL